MLPSYTIGNLSEILEDIYNRNRVIQEYRSIIERRIKIEKEHSHNLRQLVMTPEFKKVKNANTATQLYFNSLINAFEAEKQNVETYVSRLEQEVQIILNSNLSAMQAETKKIVGNIKLLTKQAQGYYDQMDKPRCKFLKRMSQMRVFKEEYMVGFLGQMSFDKKNKLFLKIKQIEDRQEPGLLKDFEKACKTYNQFVEQYTKQMKENVCRLAQLEKNKSQQMKNIFLLHQIAGSQFGANLVQQNNVVLSRMDQFKKNHPDFIDSCEEKFQEDKKKMIVPFCVPHAYINTLFVNMIKSEASKNLINYGQKETHRFSLHNTLMNNAEILENGKQPSTEYKKVQQVGSLFKGIFDVNQDEEEINFARAVLLEQIMRGEPESRKNFILCLQKFRRIGKFQIESSKIPVIRRLFNSFLTICEEEKDTYNSKLLMVLSFTYHSIEGQCKFGLHELIKQHPIWLDKDWWEAALIESVYEQLKVKSKKSSEHSISIWQIKGSGLKHTESQHELTFQNIIFNQITYYVHNMRLFSLRQEQITMFAKKYARYFGLNNRMMADMEGCLVITEVAGENQPDTIINGAISSPLKNSIHKFLS